MKSLLTLFASLCATACTTEPAPPTELVPGTWERHDDQGRVIDRLVFDGADNFRASEFYYHEVGPVFGDFSDVTGKYSVTDQLVKLTGKTRDGYDFVVMFTYHADDEHFVRGAFVLDPDEDPDSAVLHYTFVNYRTFLNLVSDLRGNVYLQDHGERGSMLIDYQDPIWKSRETESIDWNLGARDAMMVEDSRLTFQRFGTSAFGQYDHLFRDIDGASSWWDTGYIYTRATVLE